MCARPAGRSLSVLQTAMGSMSMMVSATDQSNFEIVLQDLLIALVTVGTAVTVTLLIYVLAGPPKESFGSALGFCVVLLIASIPIALKVVCTVTLSLGAGELAKDGAIVSRISSIEELAGITMLCSDKTGTLTKGKMQLKAEWDLDDPHQAAAFALLEPDHPSRHKQGFHRMFAQGKNWNRRHLLELALLATRWREWQELTGDEEIDTQNNATFDPIDTMLLASTSAASRQELDRFSYGKTPEGAEDFDPFNSERRRVMAQIVDSSDGLLYGKKFRVAKGAAMELLNMSSISDEARQEYVAAVESFEERGVRVLAVAKSDDVSLDEAGEYQGWYIVGLITFLDPVRPDSAEVIKSANRFGVEVKMITGDNLPIAKETCKTLGMGSNILAGIEHFKAEVNIKDIMNDKSLGERYGEVCSESNGFAKVLPEHKYLIVQTFKQLGHLVGMCGDGVNDAPALKKANVGIAVSGAKEAAQAASDIVLTEPGLGTIVKAMVISRKIFTRMQNFVIYRVACTEQLLFFFLISTIAYDPKDYMPDGANSNDWPNYFALPVLALVTITILNDGTIISVAYDNVEASLRPQSWDLKILYWTSSVIGLMALVSSIVLLQLALDGADGDGGLCAFGLDAMSYGEIQTLMYLKISLSDYGSVFNSRTKSWCWTRAPSLAVVFAALVAVVAATLFSAFWPFGAGMESISWQAIGFVWAYTLVWSVVQDAAKVLNYRLLECLRLVEDLGVIDESVPLYTETDGKHLGKPVNIQPVRGPAAGFVFTQDDRDGAGSTSLCPRNLCLRADEELGELENQAKGA